jgi:hypothetical protein
MSDKLQSDSGLRRSERTARDRIRGGVALAIIGAGIALLLSPAGAALSSSARDLVSDPPPVPVAGPGEPSSVVPSFSAADKAQALSLLASDSLAQQALAGRGYTVDKVGPWTDSKNEQLGFVLHVTLEKPASFGLTDWPAMIYDRSEVTKPPYKTHIFPAAASGVTEFTVEIDLASRRVVGMKPGGSALAVTPGPGVVRTTTQGRD